MQSPLSDKPLFAYLYTHDSRISNVVERLLVSNIVCIYKDIIYYIVIIYTMVSNLSTIAEIYFHIRAEPVTKIRIKNIENVWKETNILTAN